MKNKVLISVFVFIFMFSMQVALTKKLNSKAENSKNGENIVSPLPGLVMIVDIKLIDNIPIIEKISSMPGRYIEKRKNLGGIDLSNQRGKPQLFVLDVSGYEIYNTKFDFPRFITVPQLPFEFYDPYTPAMLPIEEPEVSIVIPYFKEAVFIEVFNPDKPLASTIKQISPIKISPSFLMPELPSQEDSKFDVLIMANNYNVDNMADFFSIADSIKQFILTAEPLSTFSSEVEIHIYDNTEDLGCYSGCSGIDRLICCDSPKVISAAVSSGYLYDEIIVVHNTNEYGGSGSRESGDAYKYNGYSTYAVAYGGTAISDWQEEVALHEFGHSFGNLCDEYTYTTQDYIYNECVNCRAYCDDWLSITTVCQTGCDAESEYFRPEDSIMLDLDRRYYNQVSIKGTYFPDGLEKRLKYFIQISLHTLTIASGTGGTTDPSPGAYTYDEGTEVAVTATPDTHYDFSSWSGDVPSGHENDNPITITMDSDKSITASFVQKQYTLTITAGMGGTTDPVPGSYTHDPETQVTITATPDSGYEFSGWSGAASGTTNPVTITMDSDKSVTASFRVITTDGDGDGAGKKGPCFIATAAYGSLLHPYVKILRDFRDRYLMPNKLGRAFVDLYYKYSPFVADFIARHKALKIAVRISLLPVIAFSYSMLHSGPAVTTVILVLIFALSIFFVWFYRRKMKKVIFSIFVCVFWIFSTASRT